MRILGDVFAIVTLLAFMAGCAWVSAINQCAAAFPNDDRCAVMYGLK